MFFSYDTGHQALVYPHPSNGRPTPFKVNHLQLAGWKTDDKALRLLPRFDPPTIQAAGAQQLREIAAMGGAAELIRNLKGQ